MNPAAEITPRQWLPATGLQRAMILASLHPESSGAYHQQLVVRLAEDLEPSLFIEAARVSLERHAALMARFEMRAGELFQSRGEVGSAAVEAVDLRGEPGSPEERIQNFLAQDLSRPFVLFGEELLWRSSLLSLGQNDFAWVWSHHHALCDAACRPLILDLFAVYREMRAAKFAGRESASPDFFDYLEWRQRQDWSAARQGWRQRFKPGDTMTTLPQIRGCLPGDDRDRFPVTIAEETEQELRRLCEQGGLTLNTIVVAAWGLWLARMQEEERAIFGIMRAARKSTIPGAESAIGLFTQTVPVGVPIPNELPVKDWLRSVREELIALRGLEHCSLGEISHWSGLELGAEGPSSVINFQRRSLLDQLRAAGLPAHRCHVSLRQTVDVPLMLTAYELPRLKIEVLRLPTRVNGATAKAAARGFEAALRAIASSPEARLGEIELLTAHDHRILEIAERGPRVAVPERTAQESIERQIRERPTAVACEQGARKITFAEFGEIAEQVAGRISRVGNSGGIVAVVLPSAPEIVSAMLGILRAGAAFVLLDPAAPRLERERLLRRLAVSYAITDEAHSIDTQAAVPRVLEIEEIMRNRLTNANPRPSMEIRQDDLAYLVHTSGSTGEKKFVEIEHRSLANTIRALSAAYAMRPSDRRISRATPGNDYFITETLVCLSAGGTLVFPGRCGAMSLSEFDQMMRRERITVTGIPASYWHEWVRAMDAAADPLPPDLRFVVCSMEKVDPTLFAKWQRIAGGRVGWINAYGPAEATIVASSWTMGDEAAPDQTNVPIGRPLPNMEVYVLDHARRKMPVGMTGEIAIAGVGVARGYRDDEVATRAKFVPNPHATSSDFARLYLTGDYGYIDECGQLVFVGRRDQQVKIAGHRIELGEVEQALQKSEHVRQAVVTAEGENGTTRLVGHILPNERFDGEAMRQWMQGEMAPHLRPADLVPIERIPIMPTGKVDRRALSAAYRSRARPANKNAREEAIGTEAKLLALWNELFDDRHVIGPADSFFHLGGNSLLAVRLLARIENEMNVKLSIHDLFTHPTIAELTALIDRSSAAKKFTSLIEVNGGGSGEPLFIVHGWSGGVFHCLEFARRLEGRRAVFGLQAVELAGLERHRSFEEMARHYADEITRARPGIAYELFGHSLGGMIAYATACELRRRGEKVRRLYLVDTLPSNLPRAVHARRVWAELRPRVVPHFRTMLGIWPRYWPRYLRARRSSLESRLRKWPSRENPERKAAKRDTDYYAVVGRDYYPPQSTIEVHLFTPQDRFPTAIYWQYLTSGPVTNYTLTSGHIDMFAGENLDHFMRVFQQASGGVHRPGSDSAPPVDRFPANGEGTRTDPARETNT